VKVIEAERPGVHNQVDFMSTFFLFVNKLLPQAAIDRILLNHMRIRV
jgi:hypothetical protein